MGRIGAPLRATLDRYLLLVLPHRSKSGVYGLRGKTASMLRQPPLAPAQKKTGTHTVCRQENRRSHAPRARNRAAHSAPHRRQRQRAPLVARFEAVSACPLSQWLGAGTETERRRPSLAVNGTTRPLLIGSTPRYHNLQRSLRLPIQPATHSSRISS